MIYKSRREANKIDDLETVLLKLYSAENITLLYEQFLEGAAMDTELRDILGNSWLIHPTGKLVKQTRVDVLVEVFSNKDLFRPFYSKQSTLGKSVLETLTWYGSFNLELLEDREGKRVAIRNAGKRKYYEPFELVKGLELVLLEISRSYGYGNEYNKEDIVAYLPESIRDALRKVLPKPADYAIQPLKQKGETDFSYCCEPTVLTELTRMVEFVQQGHLTLKKNGEPSVKGLRDLASVAGLQEFYQPGSGKEIERLRVEILISFLLSVDLKKAGSLSSPQVFLRRALKIWVADDDYLLTEQLLEHLRIKWNRYYADASWNVKKKLLQILKELHTESWVSIINIYNYCVVRQVGLLEKQMGVLEYQMIEKTTYGSWDRWEYVGPSSLLLVVYLPMLRAFFFLAASLGLVEIGYNLPVNENIQRPKRDYLSRFDGLQYVRLTELGAYVTGKTKKYTSAKQKQASAVFTLDETRLLLTMEGDDPIAALTLEKMLERVGSGRYMMTFESLFKDCRSKRDVQQKISLFRKTICKKPPKIWLDFFAGALLRVNPLAPEPGLRVFTINQDEELLQLLASAPDITPLIFKVEGLRIAVRKTDISTLTSRLKKHGYLISGKSLIG